jgi:hypothetical protein
MRAADIQATFPAILIAMLVDGTSRALFGNQRNDQVVFWVMVLSIGLSFWVQYARTVRGSTLVEKNKDYVLAARLIGIRRAQSCSAMCCRTWSAGAGDRDHQSGARDHHRGDAVVPRPRPALDAALARHADPDRQKYLFAGEWWIAIFPGTALRRMVVAVNLLGDWSARRAEPETAMTPVLSVRNLKVEFPTRRGILTAIDDISFDIAPAKCSASSASPAPASRLPARRDRLIEPPAASRVERCCCVAAHRQLCRPRPLRKIRGKRIGMVFQDPLTSLNPLYRIGDQLSKPFAPIEPVGIRPREKGTLDA